jgi:hypothetical protein
VTGMHRIGKQEVETSVHGSLPARVAPLGQGIPKL